jgi:diadenosine tetraphosphate (Ap4A) HIT family hydrolase
MIFKTVYQRELILESPNTYSVNDLFPVSNGHPLIVPKMHYPDYFELTPDEQRDCWSMVNTIKQILVMNYHPDGFNVAINVNEEVGQTITHVHIHLDTTL